MTAVPSDVSGDHSKLVIIIAGPTGSGKSDVAAHLSSSLGEKAWIVSADSVQSYRHVQIGANKPSKSEQEDTPHLLIDMVDPDDNNYNAAEWRRDALWVIDKLLQGNSSIHDDDAVEEITLIELGRRANMEQKIQQTRRDKGLSDEEPIIPIVVGGTMMYLQWLVDGKPDAARPTPAAASKAMKVISEFQQREMPSEEEQAQVWHEAVQYVSTMGHPFDDRAATLGVNDWYRLRRILEVAYTSQEQQHHGDGEQNDFSSPLQLEELYTGKRAGALETFGWDVRCFFLCPDDRMAHTEVLDRRCEEMVIRGLIQETADLLLQEQLPVMAARAIGYRQTLDYLQRENAQMNNRAALEAYLNEFTTSTRRYAKRQMQWFRRDQTFVFVPVSVSVSKEERILTAAGQIYDMVRMSRDQFDQECFTESSISQQTRSTNEKQGKEMRLYQFRRYMLTPEAPIYSEILQQADECTRRIQESQKRLILEDQTEGTVGNRLIAFE